MSQFNIPTARWKSFTDCEQACNYIRDSEFPALVVKASGLAAGKGVIVAQDKEEACQAAVDILQVWLSGIDSLTVDFTSVEFACMSHSKFDPSLVR